MVLEKKTRMRQDCQQCQRLRRNRGRLGIDGAHETGWPVSRLLIPQAGSPTVLGES